MEHAVLGAGPSEAEWTAWHRLGEGVTYLVQPERLSVIPRQLVTGRPSDTITAPGESRSHAPILSG